MSPTVRIKPLSAELPKAFCWTKIGAESGEQLDAIIRRKEWERQMGDGVFFWGIGNGLGDSVHALAAIEESPQVLFSPIRSKERAVDVNPSAVQLWLSYISSDGREVPLPSHSFVTSRVHDGDRSTAHYALVCSSNRSLIEHAEGTVRFHELRNLKSQKKLGFSQVTSVVEHHSAPAAAEDSLAYPVRLRAHLAAPYLLRLHRSAQLSSECAEAMNDPEINGSWSAWARYVKTTKQEALLQLGRSGAYPLEEQLMFKL